MSESNGNAPSHGTAVTSAAQAADIATKQSGAHQDPYANLKESEITPEKAREIIAYREAQAKKAAGGKETKGEPTRGADGKFQAVDKFQEQPKPKADKPAEAVKEAIQEAKRKLKFKDESGADVEVDEEEVLKTYRERKGHQRAANKEFQEGRAARKQAEEFIAMMKDPSRLIEVMTKMGHDPRKLAEDYLVNALNEEQMDPREKELRDAKAKLKSFEDLERKKLEDIQKQRDAEMKQKYMKDYETQFVEALKTSGLPPTKPMVAEMAKYISRSAKIGFKMTPAEAAQLVREDIQLAHSRLVGDSDAETLIKLLGDAGMKKIREYDIAKLKDPTANLRTPQEQAPKETRRERGSQPTKRMSPKEWREFNRKK